MSAHEAVPADIAAAINRFARVAAALGARANSSVGDVYFDRARSELEAAILHHLRAYDEMKAALEAQTSGGA